MRGRGCGQIKTMDTETASRVGVGTSIKFEDSIEEDNVFDNLSKCLFCRSECERDYGVEYLQGHAHKIITRENKKQQNLHGVPNGLIGHHLQSIFVLEKMLGYPKDKCYQYLQRYSTLHPGLWFSICFICRETVDKCYQSWCEIMKHEKEMEQFKRSLMELIVSTNGLYLENKDSKQSIVNEIRSFVVSCTPSLPPSPQHAPDSSGEDNFVVPEEINSDLSDSSTKSNPIAGKQKLKKRIPNAATDKDKKRTRYYWCSYCRFRCKFSHEFKQHYQEPQHLEARAKLTRDVQCQFCDKSFFTSANLKTHQRHVHHKEINFDRNKLKKYYWCATCRFRSKLSHEYKQHFKLPLHLEALESRNRKLQKQCQFCDKSFRRAETLSTHQQQVHRNELNLKPPMESPIGSTPSLPPFSAPSSPQISSPSHSPQYEPDTSDKDVKVMLNDEIHSDSNNGSTEKLRQIAEEQKPKEMISNAGPDKDKKRTRYYWCSTCRFRCKLSDEFKQHYKEPQHLEAKANLTRDVQCQFCDKSFFTSQCLKIHEKHVHYKEINFDRKNLKRYYWCAKCRFRSKLSHEFKQHYKLPQHIEALQPRNPKDLSQCQCQFCGKSFCRPELLSNHQQISHHKELNLEPFKCDECGKCFYSNKSFKIHLKEHKTGDFVCEQCGKVFTVKRHLDLHLKAVHTKVREFGPDEKHFTLVDGVHTCEFCPKQYMTGNKVKAHIKKYHLHLCRFKCTGCDKVEVTSGGLYHHMAMCPKVNEGRAFKCPLCEESFFHALHLVKHRKAVHPETFKETRYDCELCGKSYYALNRLVKHKKTCTGLKSKSIKTDNEQQ